MLCVRPRPDCDLPCLARAAVTCGFYQQGYSPGSNPVSLILQVGRNPYSCAHIWVIGLSGLSLIHVNWLCNQLVSVLYGFVHHVVSSIVSQSGSHL